MSAAIVLTTFIIISPIVVRNYLVFPDFTPTGGTIGVNLWEGLGETELGRSAAFMYGDDKMIERERIKMGLPAGYPIEACGPTASNGTRTYSRVARVYQAHPVWYCGVMLHRMWGMLKVLASPRRTTEHPGSMSQHPSVSRSTARRICRSRCLSVGSYPEYCSLCPGPAGGNRRVLGWRKKWKLTLLLLATIFYYLVPGTFAHTEIRYVQPVHGLLPIFAAVTLVSLWRFGQLRLSH
jgi:hypothetical protein